MKTMRFSGKTAVVTGAAGGMGREIAKAFASESGNVALIDINQSGLQELKESLSEYPVKVEVYNCNIMDYDTVQEFGKKILADFGSIEILVNNAGGGKPGQNLSILDEDRETWEFIIALNLSSAYYCIKAFVPQMVEKNYGKVVNISSVAGVRGGGLIAKGSYAVAKSGILGLTKILAREVGPNGVNVNAIAPGLHLTPSTAATPLTEHKRIIDNLPLRQSGNPKHLAQLVAFLASDDAPFITGSVITADGGYSMH